MKLLYIIYASVHHETAKKMIERGVFSQEKLPLRYLGVPMILARLYDKACKPLIYKIT